jgi:prepilin-type processing-associated H-X9-DG protein
LNTFTDNGGTVRTVNWVAMIFPYIEHNDLWMAWHVPATFGTAVYLKLFVCPSNPSDTTVAGSSPLGYCVNTGIPDATSASGFSSGRASSSEQKSDGVFFSTASGFTMSMDYLSQHDGSSNTLMLSENILSISTSVQKSGTPVQWGGTNLNTTEEDLGFQWDGTTTTPTNHINSALANTITGSASKFPMPPSSRHGSGVVVSFCDGHQEFLRDDISACAYDHIMTPDSALSGVTGTFGQIYDPATIQ